MRVILISLNHSLISPLNLSLPKPGLLPVQRVRSPSEPFLIPLHVLRNV